MTQPTTFHHVLPCGCQRGVRLCQQAHRLRDEIDRRLRQFDAGVVSWTDYKDACWNYSDHFSTKEQS